MKNAEKLSSRRQKELKRYVDRRTDLELDYIMSLIEDKLDYQDIQEQITEDDVVEYYQNPVKYRNKPITELEKQRLKHK